MTTFTQPFSLTASAVVGVAAPPQASGTDQRGNPFAYTNMVLNSTFAATSDVGSGVNGDHATGGTKSVSGLYSYNPNGGTNRSAPAGGLTDNTMDTGTYSVATSGSFANILQVNHNLNFGNGLTTVNYGNNPQFSAPGSRKTDLGGGLVFQYGYFECEIAFDVNLNGYWPSWWSWSYENAVTNPSAASCELDFVEIDRARAAPGGPVYCFDHYNDSDGAQWGITNTERTPNNANLNFTVTNGVPVYNKYGFLWTPTSIQSFFNGVGGTVESTINTQNVSFQGNKTGNGTTSRVMTALNVQHSFMILGSSETWPMYVRSLRVWQ